MRPSSSAQRWTRRSSGNDSDSEPAACGSRTEYRRRCEPHTLWVTADSHLERTSSDRTTKLTITQFVPLARYLGKKVFAFEEKRSLVGLPVKDAIAQITSWTDAQKLSATVEGDADALASTLGTTAEQVVVFGSGGSTTPLSKMPARSIDVSLPPTEGNFEAPEYNFTRLRIWVDDNGVVAYYWFDLWLDTDGDTSARALLAKTFGKPTKIGAGYEQAWFVGISLGGLGSVLAAKRHGTLLAGVVLSRRSSATVTSPTRSWLLVASHD